MHDPVYTPLAAFARALRDGGVRHVCVAPGSRSTPLALVFDATPGIRIWVHIDERSAAFFALGIARTLRAPVAVICTSGTAAANFLPAVIEAGHARLPLLLFTADRPADLRDCGASQTIDQIKLYGSQVRWFHEVGLVAERDERSLRALAVHALHACTLRPPGPVHLNFPFQEPLLPEEPGVLSGLSAAAPVESRAKPTTLHPVVTAPSAAAERDLAALLDAADRPLIVSGPITAGEEVAEAVTALAARLDAPILADPLSPVRGRARDRTRIVGHYDALLRVSDLAARLQPDLVLRFGSLPTSKATQQAMAGWSAPHVVVEPQGTWNDPIHAGTDMLTADVEPTCRRLTAALSSAGPRAFTELWCTSNREAGAVIRDAIGESSALFEGRVFPELARLVPADSLLFVGNSMPLREMESFWPADAPPVRVLANRGANGIDGFVSSGLGAAAVWEQGPVVLVTGDLGFYHDLNGLLAARQHGLRALIVVLHNDGGGIFSFLPQAERAPSFEKLFRTPHGLDFRFAADLYGLEFRRVGSWDELRNAVREGLAATTVSIVEIPCDANHTLVMHRQIHRAVAAALGGREEAGAE